MKRRADKDIEANKSALNKLLDAKAIAARGVKYSDGKTPLIATWLDMAMRAHPSIMSVGVDDAMVGHADTSAALGVDYACDFDPCLPSSASTSGLFTSVNGIQRALGASLTSTPGTLDYAIWNVQCMDASGCAHVLDECPQGIECAHAPKTLGQYLTSKGYGPKHLNLYLYPHTWTAGLEYRMDKIPNISSMGEVRSPEDFFKITDTIRKAQGR